MGQCFQTGTVSPSYYMQKRNFWKAKWVKERAKWVKERAKWVNRKSKIGRFIEHKSKAK